MPYKTENQIISDIIGVINTWLATSGQTGWKVAQEYQPRPMGLHDKAILLAHIYSRQIGFQKGIDCDIPISSGGSVYTHIESWLEEVRVQISCICFRNPASDTASTWTAADMAKRLIAYFNSMNGVNAMCALGYGKFRNDGVRIRSIVNDSESFMRVPNFDLVFAHEQTVETQAIAANFGGLEVFGV